MTARSQYWSATLMALAMTISLPAQAQESTGDPFLDAMINDQQTAAEDAAEPTAPETTPQAAAPSAPTMIPTGTTGLIDQAEMNRELGDNTALFSYGNLHDGKPVRSVAIRYVRGSRVIPDARLYDVIQTRAGQRYSTSVANDDLKRLIERGLVGGNARIAVESQGSGVRVIFEVVPADVMGGVSFTGNARFSDEDLRESVNLASSSSINDRAIAQARAAIVKKYHEAGYPDVKVGWRNLGTTRQGYKDVIFDINEGKRISMSSIKFEGNKAFDDTQLRQVMQTKERGLFTWITKSGRIDRQQVEEDLQEIIRHYRNHGYLRARITDVRYSVTAAESKHQRLHMQIFVDEGPRYRVRHVTFGPMRAYTPAELHPGLSMLDGDVYSLKKVSDDTTMIRDYYGAKGYADAEVSPDINEVGVAADGSRLVDIRYNITEGGRYAVGRVNVRGNTRTKSHVILRELPFRSGQSLNSVDLETAEKRLENLKYFDMVDVSQSASGAAGYRDINVNVHETQTGTLTLGMAFSSVESMYFYVNSTQSNFDLKGLLTGGSPVGGGQRLTLSARLGFEYQSASVFLLEPWFLDRKLSLSNELYYSSSTYMSDYYEQTNFGYAVSLRRALSDKKALRLSYRLENYQIDAEHNAPAYFQACDDSYIRSNITIAYEYDSRDAMITPRKGGNLDVHATWSTPGSTVQTVGFGVSGSYYYNAAWDSIFSVNFGFETIDAVSSGDEVPIFERCYLGGPANLRGFRFRDVGMVTPETGDETMGGCTSAFAQFEVTVPVMDSMRLAAFVDVGVVNQDAMDLNTSGFCADAGFGIRLNLPMGPLAVDYAIPLKTGNAVDRSSGQFQFYVDYKY